MFSPNDLKNVLYLDIETASEFASYEELTPEWQAHWDKKHESLFRNNINPPSPSESYIDKAAIFAEFGRIICITCGVIRFDTNPNGDAVIKTFFDVEEKNTLSSFREMAQKFAWDRTGKTGGGFRFCGHNIKEFDLPYICRRMCANQLVPLQEPFLLYGKKPWEINHIDTMELWKFGDQKAYTRLDLMTSVLGVDSPKGDLDGSKVGQCFHHEKDYDRIIKYCEEDVKATINIILRLSGLPLITNFQIRA